MYLLVERAEARRRKRIKALAMVISATIICVSFSAEATPSSSPSLMLFGALGAWADYIGHFYSDHYREF
jgi:hypothetical protein